MDFAGKLGFTVTIIGDAPISVIGTKSVIGL